MWDNTERPPERWTPWFCGTFAVVMIVLGAYMSFGGTFHHDEVSAASRTVDSK